ncbi:MAG: hypothetical protein ACPGVD_08555, partial [Flavobacteriales bacterium]
DSVITITWTNKPSVSGIFNSSGGNNITGNARQYTIPNTPGTDKKVYVSDYNNGCKIDYSNLFTILPKTPKLTYPNGGEIWRPACDYTIRWDQSTFYTNVRIEYSINNGLSWNTLVSSTTNDGFYPWNNISSTLASTQVLVKVLSVSDLSRFDISDGPLTIKERELELNPITEDTLYGCTTKLISWTRNFGCVYSSTYNRVNLKVSMDNGTTWSSLASNVTSTGYTYSVPNGIDSDSVLFRVESVYYGGISSQSDSTLSIKPTDEITVTYPSGGEIFAPDSVITITWTNKPTVSGIYNTSGGSNITGNSVQYTIPNSPGSNKTVYVRDYSNSCKIDYSNLFTILKKTPKLTYPNGGETFLPQCDYTIRWDQSTFYTNVRIEYSIDNGLSWNTLVSSTANDGSYPWNNVSASLASNQVMVKILSVSDLLRFDISDAPFTIKERTLELNPIVEDTLFGCTSKLISWTRDFGCVYSSTYNNVRLKMSMDNGTTWSTLATTTGSAFNYSVPNTINSDSVLFRVESIHYSGIDSESDSVLSIKSTNEITVVYPAGGEVFAVDSVITIIWTNQPTVSGIYNISGASNITGNTSQYTVPNSPGTNKRVFVKDYNNGCKQDYSEYFTILPKTPKLTYPNGGEYLYSGNSTTIRWDQSTFYTNVRIDYSIDNGFTWIPITTNTSNDGSHNWSLPNVNSTRSLVKVSSVSDVSRNDISDNLFTIKPAVDILNPNGDDGVSTLRGGCTVTSITFNRSTAWNKYKIEYSIDNGVSWTTIVNNWTSNANPATYNWTIPNISTTDALIKVTPTSVPAYFDESDNTFTIKKPVQLLQPSFGGLLQTGTSYNIEWSSDGISNVYDLEYSVDNGVTWIGIVTGYVTSTNKYPWLVPNNVSNSCRIRVTDNLNSCKQDISQFTFSISNNPSPIKILYPNGGENIISCSNDTIKWFETTPSGLYNLYYSSNNGVTWVPIVTGYATSSQYYVWSMANLNIPSALIRIEDATSSEFDLSDALFSLLPANLEVFTNDTTICNGSSVQLSANGAATYQWSPAAGLSNANIANPLATPSSTTNYVVTSSNGVCTVKDSVLITSLPLNSAVDVSITHSPSSNICSSSPITFTATGVNKGSSPVYQWLVNGTQVGTNSNSFTSSSLSNGDQVKVELTSSLLCVPNEKDTSNTITLTILSSNSPTVSITSSNSGAICSGTSVTFTATDVDAGTSPTYQWKVNGINAGTNSSTFTTTTLADNDTVSVEVTSNGLCNSGFKALSNKIIIEVNSLPGQPLTINGKTALCEGEIETYSIASVSDASDYTWTLPSGWIGTSTTNSIQVVAGASGGTIQVKANNACGSSTNSLLAITVNSNPSVSINLPDTSICEGASISLSGNGALSYSWNNGVSNGMSFSPASNSSYKVIGTDANGCSDSAEVMISINFNPTVSAGTDKSICDGEGVILSGAGAANYSWDNEVVNGVSFVPVTSKTYVVTGTDVNGCTNTDTTVVTVNTNPSVSANSSKNTLCLGDSTLLSATGSAANYSWNYGVTNGSYAKPSSTIKYIVTGSNTTGCFSKDSVTIQVNTLPIVGTTISNNNFCVGGSTVLSGTGATTYSWNNGVSDGVSFSPAVSSIYEVTGTDINGCKNTAQAVIAVNQLPNVYGGEDTLVCNNSSITLTGNGALTYAWNNGITNGVPFMVNNNKSYIVSGTDANGCVGKDTVAVGVSSKPSVIANTSKNSICLGDSTLLSASGTAATYTWNYGVSNGSYVKPSSTIKYVLTGINSSGCENKDSVTVQVNSLPSVGSSASNNNFCIGGSTILTGTGASSYSWDNGVTNGVSFSPSLTTTYEVTGTDANGCSNTAQATINVNQLPNVNGGSDQLVCNNSSIALNASGASTYSWNNGITNGVPFIVTTNKNYIVTGTDANGCVGKDTVLVVVNVKPIVTANASNNSICIGGSTVLSASGNAVSYSWNYGVTNGSSVSPTSTIKYIVTGLNSSGCSNKDSVTIQVNSLPNVGAT